MPVAWCSAPSTDPDLVSPLQRAAAIDVIAAGKGRRRDARMRSPHRRARRCDAFSASARRSHRCCRRRHNGSTGGHPLPNAGSVAAARPPRSTIARGTAPGRSAGGAALRRRFRADGAASRRHLRSRTSRTPRESLMDAGRRHLRVEHRAEASLGDQRRSACRGRAGGTSLTLAVSDVVGDDLSVIASGPTVAGRQHVCRCARGDRTARRVGAVSGRSDRPTQAGAAGRVPETPARGRSGLARVGTPASSARSAARSTARDERPNRSGITSTSSPTR